MFHDGVEVALFKLDDLLGPIDVQEVSPLQVPGVLVPVGWSRLLRVLVELPVHSDCRIVCENVQVLSELLKKVRVLA